MDVTVFSVSARSTADEVDLVVAGDVDVYSADELASLGLLHLTQADTKRLVIDLADVTFIDSTGIGALVRIRNTGLEFDKAVALRGPSQRVQKVLKLTALDSVFEIE